MSKPEISSGGALSPILRYGLALACPCVALAVALLLVRYGFTNSVFLFGIAIVSWFAGPGPAVLAVVLSTVAHAYFFIQPIYSFVITPSEIPRLILFVLFASLITGFAAARRRVERELRKTRDKLAIEAVERTRQASLLNLTHDTIFVRDMSDIITYWNRGAQELYGWMAEDAIGRRAQLLAEDWNRKTVITTLISDVATAYFNLLEPDMELAIAKNTLKTRAESLRLIKVQQQGGVATLLDTRQGEQLVYSAAESIPDAERQIEQTENKISLLLGRNPGPVPRSRRLTEQQTPPEVPAGLPSSLLEKRPDIQAAEQILVAANANIGVAKAAYFPQITLTGEFGFQSTSLANLFSGSRRAWTFVPQITYPIFDAGRTRFGVERAEAEQRSALAQYEKAIQSAFRDVSDALVQYQKVREIRAERELLVTALQDRKRLAYLTYRGGVDTLLNALDADRDLFSAEFSLAQIRLSELLSLVQLYRALGGLAGMKQNKKGSGMKKADRES